jgi:hypothetical protein
MVNHIGQSMKRNFNIQHHFMLKIQLNIKFSNKKLKKKRKMSYNL